MVGFLLLVYVHLCQSLPLPVAQTKKLIASNMLIYLPQHPQTALKTETSIENQNTSIE